MGPVCEWKRPELSERAVIGRIHRKLAHKGERLCTLRGDRAWNDLGRHYVIDAWGNYVVSAHVDVEDLARDLGVIHPTDVVAKAAA